MDMNEKVNIHEITKELEHGGLSKGGSIPWVEGSVRALSEEEICISFLPLIKFCYAFKYFSLLELS